LHKVFEHYYPVTVKLSAQAYPLLYNVLLQYIALQGYLQAAVHQNGGVGLHSLLANAIQAGIDKLDIYLDKSKLQTSAAIATILNPRMKLEKLRDIRWTSAEQDRDRRAFIKVFNDYTTRFGINVADNKQADDDDSSDDELALDELSPLKRLTALSTEAERYLADPLLRKSDPKIYTDYWQGACSFYPILARMARDYSLLMATSVPCESVFSIAGLHITKRRNRLAPKTMGMILCLRSWGLLPDEDDDDDEEVDDVEDIRKDWK
jgi:hypothetical protein